MKIYKKLFLLLNPDERRRAGFILIMIIIMAFLDTIGVASILPFMAVLTNPELIETNIVLKTVYQELSVFGVKNNEQFLFFLGGVVFILLVVSLIFKTITTYFQVRFVELREHSISKHLVKRYLNQSYSWFLSRNSAEIGKTILSDVQQLIAAGIRPLMELIAKGMVTISLIILLIIANPKLAAMVGLSLGGAYLFIFYYVRNYLSKIGNRRSINNRLRFKTLSEAFGASKEIKFKGLEEIYIRRFSDFSQKFALSQASAQVISQLPRFILEAVAFGGIMLIILYRMTLTGNLNSSLPILSLYVFAGYRLLPAMQQIYNSITQLTFISPVIDKLDTDLKSLNTSNIFTDKRILPFKKSIALNSIHYSYPNSSRSALSDVSLNIPAKTTVGLIGVTGSGKTTIIDIILGLLEPQKGTLEVDGRVITKKNCRNWQNLIGYVPQQIYLSDDTIAANIAFGIHHKDIDLVAIENVSKISKLHEFVINDLPNKYKTEVGERGIRLSGGQRQRIGIARALYNNPKLLILDEATSALDNQTEKAVMDAVNNLSKDITTIIIAHRLNTVKDCDIIFRFENGKLIEKGTYEKVINSL
jgi:ATP-binding cassette, subfamily B, bacterial PglK